MKRLLMITIFTGAIGLWLYQTFFLLEEKIDIPEATNYRDFVEKKDSISETNEEFATSTEELEEEIIELVNVEPEEKVLGDKILADSINLNVPFTSQAPTGNWALPWNDACEEASLLMVDYYYQDRNMHLKETTEKILADMVNWQENNWQGHFNLTLEDLDKYIKENNYDYDTEIIEDLDLDKIKKYLNEGSPIIVPANGKKLENPYFRNGGPEYHMLVIKGYIEEDKKIITNDPGTRMGENFLYDYDSIIYAIADWDKKSSSATGPKRGLILYKK